MTRKDYILAAKMVKESKRNDQAGIVSRGIENFLVRFFAEDEPNFSEAKFREECKKG